VSPEDHTSKRWCRAPSSASVEPGIVAAIWARQQADFIGNDLSREYAEGALRYALSLFDSARIWRCSSFPDDADGGLGPLQSGIATELEDTTARPSRTRETTTLMRSKVFYRENSQWRLWPPTQPVDATHYDLSNQTSVANETAANVLPLALPTRRSLISAT
jgi:hypothetical protein